MGKTWVANTTSQPKPIDGRMVLPGDGVFVDDGAPTPQRTALSVIDEAGKAPVIEVDGQRYGLIPEAAAAAAQAMVSGAGNLAVTYDGSGRAATLTKGARSYSYAYSAGGMVITASDGAVANVALDGSNRVTGLTGNF